MPRGFAPRTPPHALSRAAARPRSASGGAPADTPFGGGAEASVRRDAAKDLVALQRQDGGWGQRPEMASDAYATGLTIYALKESGSELPAGVAGRASEYLRTRQRADGSWHVRSRSAKFQPYFEGGFPYEHDQWISSMATGWATAALALSTN